jgi:cell division protein FtsZ
MKGARGLLISITGGRDLKLYEVDEAATRIREEVDQDANIIVGATFDESLDGIIRVSVVATGIDQIVTQRQPLPQAEQRIAEVAQRMRAEAQRSIVERVVVQPEPMRAVAQAPVAPAPAMQAAPAPMQAPAPAAPASISSVAKAAIAAAILPQGASDDVTFRPLAPKPSLFIEPSASEPEQTQEPEAFIPPAAERPLSRAPRMPRIDELPMPAQNEIRAKRGEAVQEEHPVGQRMSLLQRIASVGGLGRRQHEDEPQAAAPKTPGMPQPAERLAGRPAPRPQEQRQEPVSEYARRPSSQGAPQGLDQHGRQAPVHNSSEEDQLDIPAFLRRQAN